MLDIDAPNGGLLMIGRVAWWLAVPLVAGVLTGLPAASEPAVSSSAVGASDGLGGAGCTTGVPCLLRAPTAVTATASDGQAEVHWVSPRGDGSHAGRYVVTSSPPGVAVVVAGRTHVLINGLPNGRRVSFAVAATDPRGQGPRSAPSNGVVPESLSSFTSTVSIHSVTAMFNGGACLHQGSQCFGIQQNSFVQTAAGGEYWIQNLVFMEDTPRRGWEAEGNYEIWNGTQQSVLACSGAITVGPNGEYCAWPTDWHTVRFPTQITLSSTVAHGDVLLGNSLGQRFPAWSPGIGDVKFIVDLHEAAVPSLLSLYAPETVIVGETGRHTTTFIGGSGSIASKMVLANGQVGDPDTQCVAESADTSTGEASVGFYWSVARHDGKSLVDFAAHRGPGDGDGVKVLPGSQLCV